MDKPRTRAGQEAHDAWHADGPSGPTECGTLGCVYLGRILAIEDESGIDRTGSLGWHRQAEGHMAEADFAHTKKEQLIHTLKAAEAEWECLRRISADKWRTRSIIADSCHWLYVKAMRLRSEIAAEDAA